MKAEYPRIHTYTTVSSNNLLGYNGIKNGSLDGFSSLSPCTQQNVTPFDHKKAGW